MGAREKMPGEADIEMLGALSPSPIMPAKINRKKVLSLIGQAQHIMITKNLDNAQMDEMISHISLLISFVKKDHYPNKLFECMSGKVE